MAEYSLGKAREKVEEKDEAIQQLDRSVQRMETIVAADAKVKEEEVENEVVEAEAEEMVGETVKEEVEEKVVEEKAVVGGQWLRVFWGKRDAAAIKDLPWDPALLAWPHPPNLVLPLLVPPESPVWTLLFLFHAAGASKVFGARDVGIGGRGGGGGVHPLGQAPAGGGGARVVGWEPELPGQKWGETPPPRKRG